MTAALGVNDDEIGDVIRLGLDTPFVGGVSIQPQFGSGRSAPPVMVVVMGGLGFWMYWGAIRGGLTRTRCVLRHPKLVLGYLALACVAGIVGITAGF